MTKIYRIAEYHFFRKFIKKYKTYKDYQSFEFVGPKLYSEQEAKKYLEDKVSNTHPDLTGDGYHYEKIAENTYKLTWKTTENFRILSFQICEFITEEGYV